MNDESLAPPKRNSGIVKLFYFIALLGAVFGALNLLSMTMAASISAPQQAALAAVAAALAIVPYVPRGQFRNSVASHPAVFHVEPNSLQWTITAPRWHQRGVAWQPTNQNPRHVRIPGHFRSTARRQRIHRDQTQAQAGDRTAPRDAAKSFRDGTRHPIHLIDRRQSCSSS